MGTKEIIGAALAARTHEDASKVQRLIEADIGARYQRPVGDKWNNLGLMSSSGSFDLKLIELATNMQDGVVERLLIARFGSLDNVPFRNPREAAEAVLGGTDYRSVGDLATVTLEPCGEPAGSRRLTALFRDFGCGIAPAAVADTIFAIGSDHKEGRLFLQGAFGLGGTQTYRNARAVVLVTRRAPEINPGEDRICVAVVEWERHTKGEGAFYLVDSEWSSAASSVEPWSAPASEFPEFEPGTHLALVAYGVEGYHRARLGDELSFDTVLNTRLFEPIMPIRFTHGLTKEPGNEYLRGLRRRLDDNPRRDRREGEETLPFNIGGSTYHLPVHFWLFSGPGEIGQRAKFVARDHVVVFTSNGQVHRHWNAPDFRRRTDLNRLGDRILVVVETDELPIDVRTSLFTPDRTDLVKNDDALLLEETTASFLGSWEELTDANRDLIRESLKGSGGEPTINIARKISRALTIKGFSLGGGKGKGTGGGGSGPGGGGGKGGGGGGKLMPLDLYDDPTMIEGPEESTLEIGRTGYITYKVNALDEFFTQRRGILTVSCDHARLGTKEIAVGHGRRGRVRVSIAVPDDIDPAVAVLTVNLLWTRKAGGIGKDLSWTTKLHLVADKGGAGGKGGKGGAGPGQGNLVAVIWRDIQKMPDWHQAVVGEIEELPAAIIATSDPDYEELATLGDRKIPTILLNSDYTPLKDYLAARSKTLTAVTRPRDEYATGVGVALVLLDRDFKKLEKKGVVITDEVKLAAQQDAARAVLSVLPEFDRLVKVAGLDASD